MLEQVILFLPPTLRSIISGLPPVVRQNIEEVRLRQGQPLAIQWEAQHGFVSPQGKVRPDGSEAYILTSEDMLKSTQLISQNSRYAFEDEIKKGFLTLPGGHRVGICGKVLLGNDGQIRTIKYVSALNFRIARAVEGCAEGLFPSLLDEKKDFCHTLIISPPRCGKTTILRDLVRLLSDGVPRIKWPGANVGLVDERSEVAGSHLGVPQQYVGRRTDVLDGCPKAEGMMLMIRSMAPYVIATDEIGRMEDAVAVMEALNAGIKVLVTVHGATLQELYQRPALRELLQEGIFDRYVVLSRRKGPGTVESVSTKGLPCSGKLHATTG